MASYDMASNICQSLICGPSVRGRVPVAPDLWLRSATKSGMNFKAAPVLTKPENLRAFTPTDASDLGAGSEAASPLDL